MDIKDALKNVDVERVAREIVEDAAKDIQKNINTETILKDLKSGKNPVDIAQKLNVDLGIVESVKKAAIKNVKEEVNSVTKQVAGKDSIVTKVVTNATSEAAKAANKSVKQNAKAKSTAANKSAGTAKKTTAAKKTAPAKKTTSK
ncbi:MAG: hypothetical protein MJ129_04260 [Clostridia bacterium]|nr:hypothetical protein [Clostridia bacterium]